MECSMKIGVVLNQDKGHAINVGEVLIQALNQRSMCHVIFRGDIKDESALSDFAAQCSMLMVVGGDGTIISAMRAAVGYDIPLLGVNAGKKGFLAEVSPEEIPEALAQIQQNECYLEHRLLLNANVYMDQEHLSERNILAVNDFNISRQGHARMIHLVVYVNNELTESFYADGILVSSPTGSTAYALSAGGPIIMPDVSCILMTPVCSHSLHSRPIVTPDHVTIRVSARDPLQDVILTIDGQHSVPVPLGGYVEITQNRHMAKLLRVKKEDYYNRYREKMIHWSMN